MNIWWKLFLIGWAFVVITRVILFIVNGDYYDKDNIPLENKPIWVQIIIHLLMIVSIVIVGGLAVGLFLGSWIFCTGDYSTPNIVFGIICGILSAGLTYALGYPFLGLYHIKNKISQVIFIIIFVVSIIGWTGPISQYYQNVVTEEQTEIVKTAEYELYYFCNIPVQKVSGNIDGSSFVGTGSVSGEILTTDELPYWYDNGKGEGLYNSVLAKDSKIIFVKDIEEPYIKIITYCDKTVKTDKNIGKEKIESQKQRIKYEFYLPESIKQYNIN